MLNVINLQGRLTKDVELRRTANGTSVCSFSIATEFDYVAKGSEKETHYIDIVAWQNTAEFLEKYFHKGDMIFISGRLSDRTYQNKEGKNVKVTEVIADHVYFGGGKKSSEPKETTAQDAFDMLQDSDPDLPF